MLSYLLFFMALCIGFDGLHAFSLLCRAPAAAYINTHHQTDSSMQTCSLRNQLVLLISPFLTCRFHLLAIQVETFAPSWIPLPQLQIHFHWFFSVITPSSQLSSPPPLIITPPPPVQFLLPTSLNNYNVSLTHFSASTSSPFPSSCTAKWFPSLWMLSLNSTLKTIGFRLSDKAYSSVGNL